MPAGDPPEGEDLRELASGDVARGTGALHEDVFRRDGATFVPPRGVFDLLERLPNQRYFVRARHGLVYMFERPPGWTDAERVPLASIRDRSGRSAAPCDPSTTRAASSPRSRAL